ncbi:hypothetical protein KPL71_009278 [Citrus sinensis]|uniref:Uncharacterized protein n=1 Tax=Citrus sinensis TaxID=2711 RepID=A0ACB8MD37_CITSI|nr:hypothetical protein KPL71_009278 [Citrus sinensis]
MGLACTQSLSLAFFFLLVKVVGVSNYSEKRLRNAYEKLKKTGIPLASNQVNYSLIYRKPEENGVKAACDELGITLIAYCPIAQAHPPALVEDYPPSDEDLTHTQRQSQELKSFATTSSCAEVERRGGTAESRGMAR